MKKIKKNSLKAGQAKIEVRVDILEESLELCPTDPGVYCMKDELGHVLYVGKAKNLRSRVRSYFQKSGDHSAKTLHLVSRIKSFEVMRTGSEVEALLLENSLIKKFKPKYNLRLKDDKTYPYLKLDLKHPFPRAYITRKQVRGDGNEYFGPFPMSGQLREALALSSKVFQLRDCRDFEFSNRSRPCLSFEIGQCTAPCVQKVSQEQYLGQVEAFRQFLKGNSKDLEKRWQHEMEEAAEKMEFEVAARLRDRIAAIQNIAGAEQRVVDLKDQVDRDFWAVYPSEVNEFLKLRDLSLVILQFRGGQWSGTLNRSVEIPDELQDSWDENGDLDTLEKARFGILENLLFQYYSKLELPQEIVLPLGFEALPSDLLALAGALEASRAERLKIVPLRGEESDATDLGADLGAELQLKISKASDREDWARLSELAFENAKGAFEEMAHLRDRKEDGLAALQEMLSLPRPPRHMECVDISNLQGEANVASCVVFKDGRPEKSQYRNYKIAGFEGQNDFASMKEVMSRRFGKPDSPKPDLLVIDGGKGQLASALEILKGLGCDFPVVGLAKARTESDFESSEVRASEERVFLPGQKNYVKFKNAEALRIMTQIRDEAHRFAIEFHRKKRSENRGL